MHTRFGKTLGLVLLGAAIALSTQARAAGKAQYHVTITNLTHAILFTPILVASQRQPVDFFDPGTPASAELATIAEAGNVAPMTALLNANPQVVDVQNSGAPLGPGESVTLIVDGRRGARYISVASMLLPTNDGFFGLANARVAKRGHVTYYSPGYDAGSEGNDELCVNIPGGAHCSGQGSSPPSDRDEGYVHVHRGTQGVGELSAAEYDWRNPVARITITRVKD